MPNSSHSSKTKINTVQVKTLIKEFIEPINNPEDFQEVSKYINSKILSLIESSDEILIRNQKLIAQSIETAPSLNLHHHDQENFEISSIQEIYLNTKNELIKCLNYFMDDIQENTLNKSNIRALYMSHHRNKKPNQEKTIQDIVDDIEKNIIHIKEIIITLFREKYIQTELFYEGDIENEEGEDCKINYYIQNILFNLHQNIQHILLYIYNLKKKKPNNKLLLETKNYIYHSSDEDSKKSPFQVELYQYSQLIYIRKALSFSLQKREPYEKIISIIGEYMANHEDHEEMGFYN